MGISKNHNYPKSNQYKFLSLKKSIMVPYIILLFSSLHAENIEFAFKEDFTSLASWKELKFPKIKKYTSYAIVQLDGKNCLRAIADQSASGLIYEKTFNIYKYPLIRWKWRISNIYKKSDSKSKSGDDYPARIYIIFKYDPARADIFDKALYSSAKLIYGEYPPHSSLNYVWASEQYPERIITSPYTGKAKMVLIEKGGDKINKWVEESADMIADYRSAFGKDPPAEASIAIMATTIMISTRVKPPARDVLVFIS